MQERMSDLSLLLGLDFLCSRFSDYRKRDLINSIVSSNFLMRLMFILVLNNPDRLKEIAEGMQIPIYLLKLIRPGKRMKSGRCVICDSHFGNVYKHLCETHFFTALHTKQYSDTFGGGSYYFMPLEYKIVDKATREVQVIKIKNGGPRYKKLKKKKEDSGVEGLVRSLNVKNFEDFYCRECGETMLFGERIRHMKNHRKKDIVTCQNCGFKGPRRNMYLHRRECKP